MRTYCVFTNVSLSRLHNIACSAIMLLLKIQIFPNMIDTFSVNMDFALVCVTLTVGKHSVDSENSTHMNQTTQIDKNKSVHASKVHCLPTSVYRMCCKPHPSIPGVTTSRWVPDAPLHHFIAAPRLQSFRHPFVWVFLKAKCHIYQGSYVFS